MRNLIVHHQTIVGSLLVVAALWIALLPAGRTQMWIYPLVRQAAVMKMNFETRDMREYDTEHFVIKYTEHDADTIAMIAAAAEQSYEPVVEALDSFPPSRTLIVVYPDRAGLRKAFGWSGDESAMGVYWGGSIQLLSPHEWLKDSKSTAEFIRTGPMVHEFTHLVFDHITNGNYPRWFTEGLAQYIEYKVNGYEWIVPGNNLTGTLYSMQDLNDRFDELPNQALSYRESLAAIRYIADVHGEDALQKIISDLHRGRTLDQSIQAELGLDAAGFEKAWTAWAITNMKQYQG